MGDLEAFELADPHGRLASVRLVQELGCPDPLDFSWVEGVWRLELALPDVDRMEYLFEVEDHNGARMTITDPGNPLRAAGAFGEKSVREFAGYRLPAWLRVEPVPSEAASFEVDAVGLRPVPVTLWAPADLDRDEPAPLLIVHDGPEYARIGGFTQFLGASIATGALPPLRAALLGPVERNSLVRGEPAVREGAVRAGAARARPDDRALERSRRHRRQPRRARRAARAPHPIRVASPGCCCSRAASSRPRLDPQESGFQPLRRGHRVRRRASNAAAVDPAPVPSVAHLRASSRRTWPTTRRWPPT